MRKFDSIMYLKTLGFNVGELAEFEYSQRKELYTFARHLFKEYGGLIVRTDFNKNDTRTALNLPFMSDVTDFKKFEDFVEQYKDKYTYILLQMIGNDKIILSGYLYLDEIGRLCGEINGIDKVNMRDAMKINNHLKQVRFEPGEEMGLLGKIKSDLKRSKLPPRDIVEFSIYNIKGDPLYIYKQLRKGI